MADFVNQNWGNFASVLGLGVSLWVLIVARGARRAAEETRSLARLKSLVEELEKARIGIEQVGIFLRDEKWDMVYLRVQDVLGLCTSLLARWGDHLSQASRNSLLDASAVIRSLAQASVESASAQMREVRRERALTGQVRLLGLISDVIGRAHRAEERSQDKR